MDASALLLAAHGSRHVASAGAGLEPLVSQLEALGRWTEVRFGCLRGEPGVAEVAHDLAAEAVVVVPLLMADGAIYRHELPRALGLEARPTWRLTPPVGCSPLIEPLIERRWRSAAPPDSACGLLLIAHGSATEPGACQAAADRAAGLTAVGFGQVAVGYLEAAPDITQARASLGAAPAVAVPLLMSAGRHALVDVRARLDEGGLPTELTPPLGLDPDLATVVAQLAATA